VNHTERSVTALIRAHFDGAAYAVLSQVRNQTGYGLRQRTADAIVMSLWPSRGLTLSGFEIKVSRADWKKELADPAKAEEISRFCDRWYLVAPPKVVEPAELPPTWGLWEAGEKKLRLVQEATIAKEVQPISRGFLGALLRAATLDVVPKSEVTEMVNAQVEARLERAIEVRLQTSDDARRLGQARRDLESVREEIATFENASGIKVTRWQAGQIGKAVEAIRNGPCEAMAAALADQAQALRKAAQLVNDAAGELRALEDRSAAE
jgi:hypothetical protein